MNCVSKAENHTSPETVYHLENHRPIAVFDSGIGGLTTVVEMQKILPHEDLIYLGDSLHSPFGNRPVSEIVSLTKQMLEFLIQQNVKAIVVACNTISTLIDHYREDYHLPFIVITEPAAKYLARLGQKKIGIIATVATVRSGAYQELIRTWNPELELIGEGCQKLAGLIDSAAADEAAIDAEIRLHMDALLAKAPDLTHVMLGCTHYPIVLQNFRRLYPSITFINPAEMQALAVRDFLTAHNGLNPQSRRGRLEDYTTGNPANYVNALDRLQGQPAAAVHRISLPDCA